MSQVLTAEQVLDLVSRRWPGEEARILQLIGLQALQLRVDLANDGGDLVGVDPPPGYFATNINELLAEIAALGSLGPPGPAGPAGPAVQVLDEGISLTLGATSINFTGAGVTASSVGPVVTVNITSGGGGGSWGSITGTLSAQTDLQAALDGKETAGAAAAAVAAHVAAGDPHPQYLTAAEGSAAFAPLSHVGAGGAAHANVIAAGAAGFMSGSDKTKLDGIATGATANSADAALLARANHTGTQLAATISDFSAAVAATAAVTANTAKVTNATHTGDVTGATTLTIADNVVTNAKLADVATATIKGRVTAATGDPEDLTATQVRTLINVANGATANSPDATLLARANHTGTQAAGTITGLATVATSGSASDLGSGTLPAARFDDTAHGARVGGTTHAAVVAAGASGFMTGADKAKLDGVATGATANATDAALRDRATHTGAQATSTITGLDTALADRVKGTVRLTVGTSAPGSPAVGDLWVDTN